MSKTPLDYQAQLDLLKSRGLIVSDEPFALHGLVHHNYYRLSADRLCGRLQARSIIGLGGIDTLKSEHKERTARAKHKHLPQANV